jgi:hypothetical protein
MNAKTTKAKQNRRDDEAMRSEYDFSKGVRGKYFGRYVKSGCLVTLDPDVAARFQSSVAVNQALRVLMQTELVMRSLAKQTSRPRRNPV